MKSSPYITWAKRQHGIKYNLAGSGMPTQSLPEIIDDPLQILESGEHEDGWQPLIKAIAKRYEVKVEQIVTVSSATIANHLVYALFLEPGDEVLVESPAYEPLESVPKYLHANVISFCRMPEKNYQPNPQEIQGLITNNTKLITLTDLHNPSGAKLNEDILHEIIKIAEQNDIYLLIDEVYLEFLYPNGERTAAKLSDHIITTRSLTKAFGLDEIRIGWIIAEASIAERLHRLKDLFATTLPFPSERLGLAAFEHTDSMLQKNLQLLSHNFQLVQEFVENESRLSWVAPPTGSVGFVKIEDGNAEELVKLARDKYQTIVVPGHFFRYPNYFRIGWGIATEELKQGLENLGKAIAKNNMLS